MDDNCRIPKQLWNYKPRRRRGVGCPRKLWSDQLYYSPIIIFAYLRPEQTIIGLIREDDDDDDDFH